VRITSMRIRCTFFVHQEVCRTEQVCSVFACGCTYFVGIGAHYKHEDKVHIFRTSRGVPYRTGVQCYAC